MGVDHRRFTLLRHEDVPCGPCVCMPLSKIVGTKVTLQHCAVKTTDVMCMPWVRPQSRAVQSTDYTTFDSAWLQDMMDSSTAYLPMRARARVRMCNSMDDPPPPYKKRRPQDVSEEYLLQYPFPLSASILPRPTRKRAIQRDRRLRSIWMH